MGRRRFVRTLASLGVTGGALTGAAQDAIANLDYDPEDEVLRVGGWKHTNHAEVKDGAFPEREPMFYTISREKWARVETARNAATTLERELKQRFDPRTVTVGVHMIPDDGGRRGIRVEHVSVEYPNGNLRRPETPFEEFRKAVPTKVSGVAGAGTEHETRIDDIPVVVVQVTEKLQAGECYGHKYDVVPGVCYFQTDSFNGRISQGTIATPAKTNDDNSPVLVTAGHNFDGDDDGNWDPEFGELHQPERGLNHSQNFVGFLDQGHNEPDVDWATVGIDSSRGVEFDMAEQDGGYKDHEIQGIRSHTWLDDHMDANLKVQGATTCTEVASPESLGATWVELHDVIETKEGDSGGPYYHTQTEHTSDGFEITAAYVAAVHRGTPDDRSKGTLMETVEFAAGITV